MVPKHGAHVPPALRVCSTTVTIGSAIIALASATRSRFINVAWQNHHDVRAAIMATTMRAPRCAGIFAGTRKTSMVRDQMPGWPGDDHGRPGVQRGDGACRGDRRVNCNAATRRPGSGRDCWSCSFDVALRTPRRPADTSSWWSPALAGIVGGSNRRTPRRPVARTVRKFDHARWLGPRITRRRLRRHRNRGRSCR